MTCKCACHQNILNKPYEHDSPCCSDMNGGVATSYSEGLKAGRQEVIDEAVEVIEGEVLERESLNYFSGVYNQGFNEALDLIKEKITKLS